MLYALTTNNLTKINIGSSGQVLKVASGNSIPIWADETDTTYTATSPIFLAGTDFRLTTIPILLGGTNIVSYTQGDILYCSSSTGQGTLSKLPIGAAGKVLKVSSGGIPEWSDDNDTQYTAQTPLSLVGTEFQLGTVPYNKGGTGLTSYTQGDLLYASADNVLAKLGKGNSGDILRMNGVGTLPEWRTMYGATSPIVLTGGTTFELTTVPYNLGGTGQTGYNQGDMLYALTTNNLTKINIGSSGQVLKVASGNSIPIWADETVKTATTPLSIIANDISLGTVPTQKGGTGFTSYAGGQLIYGSVGIGPPNALSLLNIGSTGQVLKVSFGGAPNWEDEVSYTAQSPLTIVNNQFQLNTVPYNKGGTGQSSWTQGDFLYASADNVLSKLGIGLTGQVLTVNTAGTLPEWGSISGASKWSVGDSGLSTEFIYPTTSTQRVAIGQSTNTNNRMLYVNGDLETTELITDAILTKNNKTAFIQYPSGNTLINHNDTTTCSLFTNINFAFGFRANAASGTTTGVVIKNDGKTDAIGSNRATDGIYNYLEYFACNFSSHFSPSSSRVIGFTSYLGTQNHAYRYNNFPVLATQYQNLYISVDNDSMVSGDRTGGYYSAYFNSSGVNNMSDARLKKDVEIIPNPLEIIRQLRGVYFKWNDGRSEERETGFIAQEVNEVFKEVVDYDKEADAYALRYDKMTGLLTEGIKAVDKENIELKEKISTLEAELNTYKAIVDKLVKAPSFKAFKESLA